uniref:SAM domain-containing protein n=1 Tax=Anopheles christyi TaxID=43041 RepID=A0A182K3H6_9DIPT
MSFQQAKHGQSTIVNQTTVPVLPIPSTTVVLPAGSGTINDLRLLTPGSSAPSGLKMLRPIAPKPATIMTTMPTMVTPSISISSAVPLTAADRSLNTVGSGSVPITGSLIVQPVVTSHLHSNQQYQPHTQQSTLYAGGSKLVLPLGTTIKVTQSAIDQQQQQQQPHLQPIPVAMTNQSHHAGAGASPMHATINSVSITQQPTQQQPTKLLLNPRQSAPTAGRTVVTGNIPPLYVPPNKAAVAAGGTVIKSTVSSATVVTNSKVEMDPSLIRLTEACNSNIVNRRMSIGILKATTAGGNAIEQQELRKPIRAFPIPELSPFTAPKVMQQQQQISDQALAPPEVCKGRLVMMSNSAPIVVEQNSNILNKNLSHQLENESADSMVAEDDLSNDGDQLVMDLGESNTHELEDKEKTTPVSHEDMSKLVDATMKDVAQKHTDQEMSEIVYYDELNHDGSSNATIELSEDISSNQLKMPSTPEKGSPGLSNQVNATGATANISPRLQKRSSSEHQRSAKNPCTSQQPSSGLTISRRRFSEYAMIRQPPAGVRIPFTQEHYYIPLPPHGLRVIEPKNPLTPIDTLVGGKCVTSEQFNKVLPTPPPPPPPPQDVMLLCNEKLELPKQLEEVRKSRSSVRKHAKPVHTDMTSIEEQELIALDEVILKKQRLGEENNTDRCINSRSTSTSSDSNMAVGKAGRSNQQSESSKKTSSKSRTTGSKTPAGRSSQGAQVTPSESSLSVQDDGGAMHDTSTVADHLRWWDGIGYLNESPLRFEFNKFGMVQPLSAEEYDKHCVTDVYKDLQQPIGLRQSSLAQNVNRSRTMNEARDLYKCEVCQTRGRAADFVTPELCSIKCLNSNNNMALRKYIMQSTHALQQGIGPFMEMNLKLKLPVTHRPPLSSLIGGVEAENSKQLEDGKNKAGKKKLAVKKSNQKTSPSSVPTASSTSDDDSMSSLSLNSSTFLKRQALRDFLPNSLDEENNNPPTATPLAVNTLDGSEETEFIWQRYLKQVKAEPAPVHLFGPKAFPSMHPKERNENRFQIGMKLEAIDPENSSLFCVCTVVEVRGYRNKLHFDGYPSEYDFWVNADSIDIFPPGWCQETNRALQPPASYIGKPFHWKQYLQETNAPVPEKEWFGHLNQTSDRNKFEIGMSIEADDLKKSGKVCVATIADKMGDRILVHFDGWDDRYDYWVSIFSNYIHPVNWHQENDDKITAPPDWNKPFNWVRYIRTKSRGNQGANGGAEKALFKTRPPVAFKLGHRLEVVDRKQKKLIRPATVVAIDGYELKLCFDGWPRNYSFWIEDDSPDLHPINWCARTKHPLEPPPNYVFETGSFEGTCEFKYCLGRGNAKFSNKKFHDRLAECPYKRNNWMSEDRKPLRISHDQVQTFVQEEHVSEVLDLKKVTSSMNNGNKLDTKEDLSGLRKSIPTVSGTLKQIAKPSAAQRRASVSTSSTTAVASKRIKRETSEHPPSTATSTSTPTPPPSRDPSKERIVRLREQEDIPASEPANATNTNTTTTNTDSATTQAAAVVSASIRLALPVIDEYGPQLLHSYEKWRQHSRYLDECTEQTGVLRKNPLQWTTDEISCYIERLPGCEEYAKKIRQEEITGRSFLSLTQADLIDYLGVKMGPAIKIYNRIIRLRQLVTTKFMQL